MASDISELLTAAGIGPNQARRVAAFELRHWSSEEISLLLEHLSKLEEIAGSAEPCGPVCNRYENFPLWVYVALYSMFAIGSSLLLPLQLGASLFLSIHGRFRAIWEEIPVPTIKFWTWSTGMTSFVKAPINLIKKSIEQQAALCVNRRGHFRLKTQGYTVMSHVWGETMGWHTTTGFGPVELGLRKMGIAYDHFIRFFDRCGADWLWVDVLAMPEVFEDLDSGEQAAIEQLRTGVINNLSIIYTRADNMVVLDSLCLRLTTGSMIDVAVILALSRWISRLWTFTDARLPKLVKIKTKNAAFDLDQIIDYLSRVVNNENHRYFPLYYRLAWLRQDVTGERPTLGSPLRPQSRESHILLDIYHGTTDRWTDVEIDAARALFPLLAIEKWTAGWTLQQGLDCIARSYPQQKDILEAYCSYRRLDFSAS